MSWVQGKRFRGIALRDAAKLLLLALVLLPGACPLDSAGTFDGIIAGDGGTQPAPGITAADIGTACTYDPSAPLPSNPTNTCRQGLNCLIFTSDLGYIPFPPGSARNFTMSVWEDQFTRYRDDGIDEGICTLIGSWQAPPACPVGTTLKLLASDLAVCVRNCQSAADCGREGYVCDSRFLDVGGGQCVRACTFDIPDCVRSGHLVFQQQGENGQITQSPVGFYLAVDDLTGASICDVPSGTCIANDAEGLRGPGEPCASSRDCLRGTACIQGDVLRSLNPELPATTQGFCAQPCKPVAQQQFSGGGCNAGYFCQAGFTFGHGNPLAEQGNQPFSLINLQNSEVLEAGGFCFPGCDADPTCGSYPGTRCGAASPNMMQYDWNQQSMCMPPALLQ